MKNSIYALAGHATKEAEINPRAHGTHHVKGDAGTWLKIKMALQYWLTLSWNDFMKFLLLVDPDLGPLNIDDFMYYVVRCFQKIFYYLD